MEEKKSKKGEIGFLIFVIVLLSVMLVTIAISNLIKIDEKNKNESLKKYDLVIGTKKAGLYPAILYGYKNGQLEQLDNKYKYKKDKSNFYEIIGTNDLKLITYFDSETYSKLVHNMRGTSGRWGIGEKYEELFKDYYDNYEYNAKDKEIFDIMLNNMIEKHKNGDYYSLDYFIITDTDYYLYGYENDDVLYKYNASNKTIDKLFSANLGDIEYFKQNNTF